MKRFLPRSPSSAVVIAIWIVVALIVTSTMSGILYEMTSHRQHRLVEG